MRKALKCDVKYKAKRKSCNFADTPLKSNWLNKDFIWCLFVCNALYRYLMIHRVVSMQDLLCR